MSDSLRRIAAIVRADFLLRFRRVSTLIVFLLLSAFGFQHVARVGETDTLLTLFSLVAILGLAEILRHNAQGWLLFWTGFALALMTKGAASLTLPLTALALTALSPRQILRYVPAFAAGLLLFVALTAPWHLSSPHTVIRQIA